MGRPGNACPKLSEFLQKTISRLAIDWSIIRFLAVKSRHPSQGVTIKLTNFIDTKMERNDKLTSPELTRRILLHFELQFSQEKVRHLRQKLGWVQTGTKYCQLIREPNRVKQLELSEKCLWENEHFNNVISTDKCSVLLENHSRPSFHHKWEQPKCKGKPKHLMRVHAWAGISKRGPTELMMFEGIVDAQFHVSEILNNGLLPFFWSTFPVINFNKTVTRSRPTVLPATSRKTMGSTGGKPLWSRHWNALPRTKEELISGKEWIQKSVQSISGTCTKSCQ